MPIVELAPDDWASVDGRMRGEVPLVIQPVGQPRATAREAWVVVAGWRHLDGPGPEWVVVLVRKSALSCG